MMEIKGPTSSKETVKSEEERDDFAAEAVDIEILPTFKDQHSQISIKNQKVKEFKWEELPNDVQGYILRNLKYEDLFQLKRVSKGMQAFIESSAPFPYSQGDSISQKVSLTALYFYVEHEELRWSGFDPLLEKWRSLPPLRFFAPPYQKLVRNCILCAGNGLLCIYVANGFERGRVVVINPMTQCHRILPPFNFPRHPVLMHMVTNATSYRIIVVGSSRFTVLSRKTEVYDSRTSQWEVTGDMPGVDFSLNEYQTGICINRILYCIAFLKDGSGKGVVAYDVDEGNWLLNWNCPLPALRLARRANSRSVVQLVEYHGELCLFQELETGQSAEHRIDILENSRRWKNITRLHLWNGRGLLALPQFVCVNWGEGQLCIFDTITFMGMVHDTSNDENFGPHPWKVRVHGHKPVLRIGVNPLLFTFEPNFKSIV